MSHSPQRAGPPPAVTLFNQHWPHLKPMAAAVAQRRRMQAETIDDVVQEAALRLWRSCLWAMRTARPGDSPEDAGRRISRRLAILGALDAVGRFPLPRLGLKDARRLPAPVSGVRVDGVTLTLADAQIDDPQRCRAAVEGATMPEVCRALGLTKQRVHQMRHRLGGVKVGAEWLFSWAGVEAGRAARC